MTFALAVYLFLTALFITTLKFQHILSIFNQNYYKQVYSMPFQTFYQHLDIDVIFRKNIE